MRILKIHIVAIIFVSLIFLAAATYLLATPITASAPRYTQISRGQIATSETCPYSFVSWNLHEMSLRKTDSALTLMTETLREADIVAVQELVAGSGFGARQISNLEARLDRTGAEWDSVTSNPTSSSSGSSERYAYLVKRPIIIRRDSATLVQELDATVEREPFLLEVRFPNRKVVRLLNVHAVPTRRRPLPEV